MRNLTKEVILQKAAEVFLANGVRNTRLEDIAKKIGVSRPNLYYYFANKNDLLMSLFDWIEEEYREALFEPLDKNPDAPSAILEMIDYFLKTFKPGSHGCCCMLGTLASGFADQDPSFQGRINGITNQLVFKIMTQLENAQKSGQLQPDFNARRTARVIVASLQGSLLMAQQERTSAYLHDLRASTDEMLESLRPIGAHG